MWNFETKEKIPDNCDGYERKGKEKMKKALFVLVVLAVGFARADNIVTSREYVDGQANTLQNTLPAKNENTVLVNTDTAGEVGEKAIYDASADYATQSDALVTAGTFNSAVQNALESEFVCIERQNGNGGCLLYEITAYRNLLNGPYFGGINQSRPFLSNTNSILTSPYTTRASYSGPVFVATVEPGGKYKLTSTTNARYARYGFYESESAANNPDNIIQWRYGSNSGLTVPDGATYFILSLSSLTGEEVTWSDVRLEKISNNYLP